MSDLDRLMRRLVEEGAGKIIANPSSYDRLKELGVDFDEEEFLTLEQSITVLFEERRSAALAIAERLPNVPFIPTSGIRSLYDEIRECILFGLNGAAITLCGILVEFCIKYSTYAMEIGPDGKYSAEEYEKIERTSFTTAVNRAEKVGLVDKRQKMLLDDFMRKIRDPYSHYNILRITEGAVFQKMKKVNFEKATVEEVDVPARDNPAFQAQAKPLVDAKQVWPVFDLASQVVFSLMGKLDEDRADGNGS